MTFHTSLNFRIRRLGICFATLTVVSILSINAWADVIIIASSSSNLGASTPAQQASSGTVFDQAGGLASTDYVEARTSATFGLLRAYGLAQSGTAPAYFGVFANNTASFRDDFLFDAAGLTGTAGTVEIKFTIDGSLAAFRSAPASYVSGYDSSVSATAGYHFSAGSNNGTYSKSESLRTAEYAAAQGVNAHTGTPFLGIEQTYTIPFVFGTTLEGVGLQISTMTRSIGSGRDGFTSQAIADLEHTAKWGGFGAVRDGNGNLLSDYSFSSGSGFDYRKAVQTVPEPSGCLFVATSLGACLLRRHRRQLSGSR